MTGPGPDPELFEAARRRGELTVQEVWLRYLTLGGACDLFELEAFLSGLHPVSAFEQDLLAVALNERLEEVYRAARVPYRRATPPTASHNGDRPAVGEDPLAVLGEMLSSPPDSPRESGSRTNRTDSRQDGAA